MIRAILFDLDETLFDHRAAVAHAVTAWTESASPGHPLLADGPALWLALEDRHVPAWHAGQCSFAEQRRRRVREYCDRLAIATPSDPDAAYDAFLTLYEQAWTAFADAAPAIAALGGRGLTLGVLTNGMLVQQEAKLRRIGLADLLDPVLSPDALGAFKPSAACYLAAAAKLGLRPEQVLMVGDNLRLDALGALRAGMRGVWLDRHGDGTTDDGALDGAAGSVERVTSLLQLLALLRTPALV
ncbi:HAD family hydrolase [Streptosporangiaceae bacterium NEAU-GS5]|nr:HAD family hydrolase [Streptosporangiaceae bacterium NEAU-GS5]